MGATLEVTGGPLAGRALELQSGKQALVGRASWADLSVPDAGLSGRHFVVEWDGTRCQLRDLKSTNGTFVNGERVTTVELRDGDVVTAGVSKFLLAWSEGPGRVQAAPAADTLPPRSGDTVQEPVVPPERAPAPAETGAPVAQVVLEVQGGPHAGRLLVLRPGRGAVVGRAAWVDLSLPLDQGLSGRHFALEWDAGQCRLRDLHSTNGTRVNGQRVQDAVLRNGDQVAAGQTAFRVQVQSGGAPPGSAALPGRASSEGAGAEHPVLRFLRTSPEPLYALLDAARAPRVPELLRAGQCRHESLYEGPKGQALANWAPYLVELPPGAPLLETLVLDGWGHSWGVYLTSTEGFHNVRQHFRRFLLVKLPDNREVYFRYYDPRVLRAFLPSCTAPEATEFFGPVGSFFTETSDGESVLKFTATAVGVKKDLLSLWLKTVQVAAPAAAGGRP